MKFYWNFSGKFGVVVYECGDGFIWVCFIYDGIYEYIVVWFGCVYVVNMQQFVEVGCGLVIYISCFVCDNYVYKFD